MKKFFLFIAMAVSAMTASAQEEGYWGNKFFDNWYVGIQGGVDAKTTHSAVFKHLTPNVGLRVGKWLSPSVGIAAEGTYIFPNQMYTSLDAKGFNANFLGQINLSNAIGGYKGEPRCFEVILNGGIGYIHNSTDDNDLAIGTI